MHRKDIKSGYVKYGKRMKESDSNMVPMEKGYKRECLTENRKLKLH
jgi:hypothetical protein